MNSTENETVQTKEKRSLPAWIVGLVFILLIGFLVLIGMGLRRTQSGPISIGQKVPAFSLITFDGIKYNTADMIGKVIVVNFWASWCKPCEQEAADMENAWQYYKQTGEVFFLGLDYVDTEPEARGFINKFGITYPNGPDLRTEVSQMFRIQGVPETYIISPEGQLSYVKKGPFESLAEIQSAIDPLLK
jgi:cytochrome c biogenesis protein CcmG/thiol:disulfide interchange protein DsbE